MLRASRVCRYWHHLGSDTGLWRELFQDHESKLKGRPNNLQKALAQNPELRKGFVGFFGKVGHNIEKRLYELIYIRVSMINGCDY